MNSRRNFLSALAGASLSPLLFSFQEKELGTKLPISCNSYTWFTFYGREGKVWWEDPDACATEFSRTGIPAIEPNINSPQEAAAMIVTLKKYNIQLPSLYVNSVLHKADLASKSIETVVSIAREAKKYNTKIVVTNPSPIEWGGTALKSDAELIEQAKNVELLGRELQKMDIMLAYHTHETEMQAGAREFHHVLQNTSPENVSFCFDVHWIYRGSANSQVAVFDVLKMYGHRVAELHIRQSVNGTWTETFGEGDIDYSRFVQTLKKMKLRPHLVMEQCLEDKTTLTMNAVEAHKMDLIRVKEVFRDVL